MFLLSLTTTLLTAAASGVSAQTAIDPSGHWEGTALVQQMQLPFEIDVVRSAGGTAGTITIPSQRIRALPLLAVTVDGRAVSFQARTDQPFTGTLSEDGTTITGEIILSGTGYPVRLTRAGEARIDPPLTSAPVSPSLEGLWNATLDADGGLRLVLEIRNGPDGTATGAITNLDEGGLRLPVAITQRGNDLTLEVRAVPITFSGTLSPDGGVLTGTVRENGHELGVTFRKAASR